MLSLLSFLDARKYKVIAESIVPIVSIVVFKMIVNIKLY